MRLDKESQEMSSQGSGYQAWRVEIPFSYIPIKTTSGVEEKEELESKEGRLAISSGSRAVQISVGRVGSSRGSPIVRWAGLDRTGPDRRACTP